MPAHDVWTRARVFMEADFPFDVTRVGRQGDIVTHQHEFSELVIVEGGSGLHVFEGGSCRIGAGEVFAVLGDQAHGYRETRELALYNILFDSRLLLGRAPELAGVAAYQALFQLEPRLRHRQPSSQRLRLTPEDLAGLLPRLRAIEEECHLRKPGYRAMAMGGFIQIVVELCRRYEAPKNPTGRRLSRLGGVLAYLEEHALESGLTLEALAEMAHMSGRTLQRQFKAVLGVAPLEHLCRLRVERACSMLRECDLPVTEVASQVGFSDSNYFARRFRDIMGMSATVYRQKHK